jgi:hypothetical protein
MGNNRSHNASPPGVFDGTPNELRDSSDDRDVEAPNRLVSIGGLDDRKPTFVPVTRPSDGHRIMTTITI